MTKLTWFIIVTVVVLGIISGFFWLQTRDDSRDNQSVTSQPTAPLMLTVHFSKSPESYDDFEFTSSVSREVQAGDVYQSALEQLLAGPTEDEQAAGLFNPIRLAAGSRCDGGGDFTLRLVGEDLTIRFCRQIESAGIGDDARVNAVINRTIEANGDNPPNVIILDANGGCFGDLSGQDNCLN
ncbi:MAG TPA: hypothetical protein VGA08_03075 [Candidatus Saccharimonadales bacterium]